MLKLQDKLNLVFPIRNHTKNISKCIIATYIFHSIKPVKITFSLSSNSKVSFLSFESSGPSPTISKRLLAFATSLYAVIIFEIRFSSEILPTKDKQIYPEAGIY